MKLITELNEEVKFLKENKDGRPNYFIQGIFIQGNKKNKNGRVYPMEILEKEVNKYVTELVEKKRAFGELGHPSGPTINLDRVSHMITNLHQEGSNFVGKAKIMDTPMGRVVKNLMDEGATLGVSSRGMGSLKQNRQGIMEVQNDFMLATAGDIVADPSAPDAFVRGIMEGAEWFFDIASGNWVREQAVDEIVTETKQLSSRQLEEQKFRLFAKFLNGISK